MRFQSKTYLVILAILFLQTFSSTGEARWFFRNRFFGGFSNRVFNRPFTPLMSTGQFSNPFITSNSAPNNFPTNNPFMAASFQPAPSAPVPNPQPLEHGQFSSVAQTPAPTPIGRPVAVPAPTPIAAETVPPPTADPAVMPATKTSPKDSDAIPAKKTEPKPDPVFITVHEGWEAKDYKIDVARQMNLPKYTKVSELAVGQIHVCPDETPKDFKCYMPVASFCKITKLNGTTTEVELVDVAHDFDNFRDSKHPEGYYCYPSDHHKYLVMSDWLAQSNKTFSEKIKWSLNLRSKIDEALQGKSETKELGKLKVGQTLNLDHLSSEPIWSDFVVNLTPIENEGIGTTVFSRKGETTQVIEDKKKITRQYRDLGYLESCLISNEGSLKVMGFIEGKVLVRFETSKTKIGQTWCAPGTLLLVKPNGKEISSEYRR